MSIGGSHHLGGVSKLLVINCTFNGTGQWHSHQIRQCHE